MMHHKTVQSMQMRYYLAIRLYRWCARRSVRVITIVVTQPRPLRREAETNGDGRVVRNRDSLSFGGVCVSRADTMRCAARGLELGSIMNFAR